VAIEWPVGYPVGMTRRRLILAAFFAVVALGAVWWWSTCDLSADEQRLVGTWRMVSGEMTIKLVLLDDHRCVSSISIMSQTNAASGHLSVRYGKIAVDLELNPVYRAFRPVLEHIGIKVTPMVVYDTEDFAPVGAAGDRLIWTRDRGN
jgi:hypothetical protein